MNTELTGRNIVVTGGLGALGRETVRLLLDLGAQCWVPSLEATVGLDIQEREGLHVIGGVDLSSEDAVHAFYAELPPLWGSVHIAGGFHIAPIADTGFDAFESMWRMNTVTCFLCCREAVNHMRKGKRGGRIVNVAARPAIEPVGGMLAYTTSKAGVVSITECLARELANEDIAVNAILPSIIDTPANRAAMPDADPASWPKTMEIAQTIAYLASPESATSGALLPVYGKLL